MDDIGLAEKSTVYENSKWTSISDLQLRLL